MKRAIQILIKNHVFFLFIFLQLILFNHLSSRNFIIESKVAKFSTHMSGYLFAKEKNFKDYFLLKKINSQLLQDNYDLSVENQILKAQQSVCDSTDKLSNIIQAKIVKNTWNKKQNFLIINKGELDGIDTQMGVINNNNIVGITSTVHDNFTTIISLLNTDLMISAKIKKSGHYGSLIWSGTHYNTMELNDIPKHANVQKGDTIVTSSYSNIFPEGLNIGIISKYENEKNTNFLKIYVKLFVDFTKINHVYLINPKFQKERQLIEKTLLN